VVETVFVARVRRAHYSRHRSRTCHKLLTVPSVLALDMALGRTCGALPQIGDRSCANAHDGLGTKATGPLRNWATGRRGRTVTELLGGSVA